VLSLALLGLHPGVLHGGNTVIRELQRVISQELHFLISEEKDESLCDVPDHFDIG
jgi:hypothetical protein